jgi:hypothetical protein
VGPCPTNSVKYAKSTDLSRTNGVGLELPQKRNER